MPWLLDTNVCIELLRGRNDRLRQRLAAHDTADIALCSVVRAELYVGAHLAPDPAEALRRLTRFDVLASYPFDEPAALTYGRIVAHLRRQGQLIGANDLMIAAIALAHGLTLVTHNTHEFGRVPGLAVEDWEV
jgi:Predicted nucleic acid-binding protein, contains PIN domain